MTELTFAMGEYLARFPIDCRYSSQHLWARPCGSLLRFGLTAYAERLFREIYFLDWCVTAPTPVQAGQQLGSLESKKAESDLYAPLAGRLVQFNHELMMDPSIVNRDMYGDGWLYEIEPGEDNLMSAPAYLDHLAQVWKIAQRMIKSQS